MPLRRYIHQQGYSTATVCARQTNHARKTRIRKSKNDLIDAINIVKVFKNGESHASRIPHPVIANLREYTRLHLFFSRLLASIANRIHGTIFISHPEFEDLFSKTMSSTALALMTRELVVPQNILATPVEKMTKTIKKASRGRLDEQLAKNLRESAHTTFTVPFATELFIEIFVLKLSRMVAIHVSQPLFCLTRPNPLPSGEEPSGRENGKYAYLLEKIPML